MSMARLFAGKVRAHSHEVICVEAAHSVEEVCGLIGKQALAAWVRGRSSLVLALDVAEWTITHEPKRRSQPAFNEKTIPFHLAGEVATGDPDTPELSWRGRLEMDRAFPDEPTVAHYLITIN